MSKVLPTYQHHGRVGRKTIQCRRGKGFALLSERRGFMQKRNQVEHCKLAAKQLGASQDFHS